LNPEPLYDVVNPGGPIIPEPSAFTEPLPIEPIRVQKHVDDYCLKQICKDSYRDLVQVDCNVCSCKTGECTDEVCPYTENCSPHSIQLNKANQQCCCSEDGTVSICSIPHPDPAATKPDSESLIITEPPFTPYVTTKATSKPEVNYAQVIHYQDSLCARIVCEFAEEKNIRINNCTTCSCSAKDGGLVHCTSDKYCINTPDCNTTLPLYPNPDGGFCCCSNDGSQEFCIDNRKPKQIDADERCVVDACKNPNTWTITKNNCELCHCRDSELICSKLEEKCTEEKCTPGKTEIDDKTNVACCCGQDGYTKYCINQPFAMP